MIYGFDVDMLNACTQNYVNPHQSYIKTFDCHTNTAVVLPETVDLFPFFIIGFSSRYTSFLIQDSEADFKSGVPAGIDQTSFKEHKLRYTTL